MSFYGLLAAAVVGTKPIQGFGLGYALATMWALTGIRASPTSPPQVKRSAYVGRLLAALGGLACLRP